mmetsp:Transcript_21532/g.48936  ORF Transcript_21532/g.48936 Transcript_21532/m.48936 type:complete len:204 (-) Transcript_21532:91-702(-)
MHSTMYFMIILSTLLISSTSYVVVGVPTVTSQCVTSSGNSDEKNSTIDKKYVPSSSRGTLSLSRQALNTLSEQKETLANMARNEVKRDPDFIVTSDPEYETQLSPEEIRRIQISEERSAKLEELMERYEIIKNQRKGIIGRMVQRGIEKLDLEESGLVQNSDDGPYEKESKSFKESQDEMKKWFEDFKKYSDSRDEVYNQIST